MTFGTDNGARLQAVRDLVEQARRRGDISQAQYDAVAVAGGFTAPAAPAAPTTQRSTVLITVDIETPVGRGVTSTPEVTRELERVLGQAGRQISATVVPGSLNVLVGAQA